MTRAGHWPSAIGAALAAAGQRRYDAPQFGAGSLYWVESRPAEAGRNVLCRFDGESVSEALPRGVSVRSRVNAYGGRAWSVGRDGQLWFVDDRDRGLYRLSPQGRLARVLVSPRRAYGDLAVLADGSVVAVCEEDGARQYLLRVTADGGTQRLHAGFDFYASPRVAPNGRDLAWVCWNRPWMPWDRSELWRGEFGTTSWLQNARRLAAGDAAWQQPLWSPEGELLAIGDREEWWAPWLFTAGGAQPLLRPRADCAHPPWVFGRQSHVFGRRAQDYSLAVCRAGGWVLLDGRGPRPQRRPLPVTEIESLARDGERLAVLGAGPDAAEGILLQEHPDATPRWLSGGPQALAEPPSRPRRLVLPGRGQAPLRAWHFPPRNARHRLRRGERPPLLVKIHGGPTAAASTALDLRTLFWTSRGFAVLAVDYRGSSGGGRSYRNALYGRWGQADVEDCRRAALAAVGRGLADGDALFASGSSAGALTALNLLVRYRCFAGATSYYGVTDLAALLAHSHRFEDDYTVRLIGGGPALARRARQRSPLFHVDRMHGPVLLLQGLDDEVVPPAQARAMHEALSGRGLASELVEFPGEGHGFRAADTIAAALERELAFYQRLMGGA